MQDKLQRVIDANLNRCREALRVCEDITRFVLNDKALTESIKNIRHNISKIDVGAYCNTPLQSRNTRTDIGKKSSFDKSKPKNLKSLFYNNIHRAEESARSLEEFSKLSASVLSGKFKALRFKLYSIEKKVLLTLRAK